MPDGDRRPTFRARSAAGEEVATATITLASARRVHGAVLCGAANGPHR